MTLPYNRNFNKGRQSDQFLNEELHRVFTALKNINYKKEEKEGKTGRRPVKPAGGTCLPRDVRRGTGRYLRPGWMEIPSG